MRNQGTSLRRVWRAALLLITCGGLAVTGCDGSDLGASFPSANVTPDRFTFPKLQVGESEDRTVEIENLGTGELKVAGIRGDFGSEFNLYWTLSSFDDGAQRVGIEGGVNSFPGVITIPPEEKLIMVLNYRPDGSDSLGGAVVMESNDPDYAEISIPIIVIEGSPELNLNPTSIDFGRIGAGSTATETITATNIGQEVLVLEGLRRDGSEDFTITLNGENPVENPALLNDPDGDGEAGVAPGQSFEVVVTYTPITDGFDEGEVVFTTNEGRAPQRVVSLDANGDSPCVNVNPDMVQFGAALIGRDNRQRVIIESCGGEPLRLDDIRLVDDGGGVFSLDADTLPPLPSQLPALDRSQDPPVPPSRGITVLFNPPEEQAYGGRLVIATNDPVTPEIEVPLVGRGTRNECPEARVANEEFVVLPLDIVTLDASDSTDSDGPDGRPVRYEWTVVSRPDGSTAVPVERFSDPLRPADGGDPDDASTPIAQFFVDLAGEYIIELQVVDNLDVAAPSDVCQQPPARVRILAEPDEDIHVQLVWDTPGDADQTDVDGSDVDLWLLHPQALNWNDLPRRCYYGNPSPDWGVLGQIDDNPSLDIDDTNGAGPENINLNNPENTQALGAPYRVALHYYRSYRETGIGDYGPSEVTVRIYLGGALADEMTTQLIDTDDFWEVAAIVWTAGDRRVQRIDRISENIPF